MFNLQKSIYDGVRGVHRIDSGNEGPVFGISACVHGGEVTGIEIIHKLTTLLEEEKIKIVSGSLLFILANLPAYEALQVSKIENNDSESRLSLMKKYRFLDENMNRCTSEDNIASSNSREVIRIKTLQPILKKIDILYDIHTTSTPSDSIMIYTSGEGQKKFSDICNVKEHLIDISEHLAGKPFLDLVERDGGIGIAIESGCENDEQGYKTGLENVLKIMIQEGIIEADESINEYYSPRKENKKIQIYDHIVCENESFSSTYLKETPLHHGQALKKGTHLGFDGKNEIILQEDSIIVMPNVGVVYVGEEFCFLGRAL